MHHRTPPSQQYNNFRLDHIINDLEGHGMRMKRSTAGYACGWLKNPMVAATQQKWRVDHGYMGTCQVREENAHAQ